jgi:hypothetical protein
LFCESGAGWPRIGNVDPDKIVALFAGITAGVDAINFQILFRDKRRDEFALAGVSVELPAMIRALDLLAVEASA